MATQYLASKFVLWVEMLHRRKIVTQPKDYSFGFDGGNSWA